MADRLLDLWPGAPALFGFLELLEMDQHEPSRNRYLDWVGELQVFIQPSLLLEGV